MSGPDRNNPYSFDPFLERREKFDYYRDSDALPALLRHYAGADAAAVEPRVEDVSRQASTRWRDLARINSLPENRPWMMHYDGHGHRIDRIVRPEESHMLEREIFGLGLFSEKTNRWERLAKLLIIHQNGEHSVTCALACTEGLVALCDAFVETATDPVKQVWRHCKEGVDGNFGTASQFLTEIQGGSDVPANRVEAEPDGDAFRLYGTKFFCSACHTDYALVTAKVTGQETVTTFIVPSWLTAEDRAAERRNGYRINRIKRKLGTIELPTAEIEYDGAVAWPIGPIGKGLANVVGYVLTTSRIAVSISNVAAMLRATREAALYGDFREVFG
ncbi:MAG: acyl-CoA dehydrogenase, partial [Candidatus Dadabacteria bacterium]